MSKNYDISDSDGNIISLLIADEYEAIESYNQALRNLKNDAIKSELIHIRNEEREHVSMLSKMLPKQISESSGKREKESVTTSKFLVESQGNYQTVPDYYITIARKDGKELTETDIEQVKNSIWEFEKDIYGNYRDYFDNWEDYNILSTDKKTISCFMGERNIPMDEPVTIDNEGPDSSDNIYCDALSNIKDLWTFIAMPELPQHLSLIDTQEDVEGSMWHSFESYVDDRIYNERNDWFY